MRLLTASVMIFVALASAANAADPAAVQAPIKGSSALDGKGRSGPDGWSWAPQTRDQAPTDKSSHAADLNSKGGTTPTKTFAPGDDPGTPMSPINNGPGTSNAPVTKKP